MVIGGCLRHELRNFGALRTNSRQCVKLHISTNGLKRSVESTVVKFFTDVGRRVRQYYWMTFYDRRLRQAVRPAALHGYLPKLEEQDRLQASQALSQLGCARIYEGPADELRTAIDSLGPGDTLAVPSLDALGSALKPVMALLVQLSSKGIHFRSIREGFDTREAIRPADLCRIFLEVQDASRRKKIKAGMSEAKQRGEVVGRPRVLRREDVLAFRQLIETPGMTVRKAADSLGINISTVRKRARSLGISLRVRTGDATPPTPMSEDLSMPRTSGEEGNRRPGRPRTLRAEDVLAFRQLVEASGFSVKQAAAELGISERALRRWARDLGISLRRRVYDVRPTNLRGSLGRGATSLMPALTEGGRRRRPRKLSLEEIAAFRYMVETSGRSVSQAAMALGVCESTLRNYARKLEIALPGRRKISRARFAKQQSGIAAEAPK